MVRLPLKRHRHRPSSTTPPTNEIVASKSGKMDKIFMLSCLQRMNDAKILRKFYTKYFRIYASTHSTAGQAGREWDGGDDGAARNSGRNAKQKFVWNIIQVFFANKMTNAMLSWSAITEHEHDLSWRCDNRPCCNSDVPFANLMLREHNFKIQILCRCGYNTYMYNVYYVVSTQNAKSA